MMVMEGSGSLGLRMLKRKTIFNNERFDHLEQIVPGCAHRVYAVGKLMKP